MRILLVEDELMLADAVRDHLLASGEAVDHSASVVDAEIMLRGTNYDVLLLDLNLPDGKGLDLLRDLRRQGSATPCIILTAQDQISDRIEGLNAGADDYLVKPFDLNELSARLAAVSRRFPDRSAVHLDTVGQRIDEGGKVLHQPAVDSHVPFGDQRFTMTARSHTRFGKHFLDPRAAGGGGGFDLGTALGRGLAFHGRVPTVGGELWSRTKATNWVGRDEKVRASGGVSGS